MHVLMKKIPITLTIKMKYSIYGVILIMFVLSITNAFSGEWKSKHHGIEIKFNDKTWSIIESNDDEDDTLIALYDKNDGSTFYIRVEYLEDAQEIGDTLIEETLAEGLYNSDSKLKVKSRNKLNIANQEFYSVDYLFNNNKFGRQLIRHAFIKKENYIIILLSSWPENTKIENSNLFPLKHMVFIEGLKL